MKWARIVGPASMVLILLPLAVYWSQKPTRFATPAACLDAYREASRAGDVERYCSCLAEPLRFEIQAEAMGLYRGAGFSDSVPFGEYVNSPLSVCMAKDL